MQRPRSFCKESMTVPWSAVHLQVSSCPTAIRCIHKDAQGSATTIRVPSVHEMKHTTCPNIELISRACRVPVTSSWTEGDLFAVIPKDAEIDTAMQVICTKATRAARVRRTSPSTPRGKSAFEEQLEPKKCCGSSVSQSLATFFAAALSWWGMLIDIVLFFVLVVVVMVMAVQRIWRLRLGNWTLWRRDGQ